jgi:hypothetical protein
MRFHLGAIPDSPDFVPDARWRPLRQMPSPMMENLLALPLGVVAAAAVAAFWFLVTPLRDITPAMLLPAFPLLFAGLVVVDELIHALVHPMAGLSPRSILGFWALLGFYAHYDGEMSRNRLVACLLMPLLVISIVPFIVSESGGTGPSTVGMERCAMARRQWGWLPVVGGAPRALPFGCWTRAVKLG